MHFIQKLTKISFFLVIITLWMTRYTNAVELEICLNGRMVSGFMHTVNVFDRNGVFVQQTSLFQPKTHPPLQSNAIYQLPLFVSQHNYPCYEPVRLYNPDQFTTTHHIQQQSATSWCVNQQTFFYPQKPTLIFPAYPAPQTTVQSSMQHVDAILPAPDIPPLFYKHDGREYSLRSDAFGGEGDDDSSDCGNESSVSIETLAELASKLSQQRSEDEYKQPQQPVATMGKKDGKFVSMFATTLPMAQTPVGGGNCRWSHNPYVKELKTYYSQ